jgi:small subunit ribosomal protein S1
MANPHSEVIGGEEDFAAMLEESFKKKGSAKGGELKENEIVRGTVVQVTKDYAVVDIGYKSEGQVPIQEFGLAEGKPNVKVGDAVEVLLESRENEWHGPLRRRSRNMAWDEISAACERDGSSWRVPSSRRVARPPRHWRQGVPPGSQCDLPVRRNLDKLQIGEKFRLGDRPSRRATSCSAGACCSRRSARR